MCSCYEHSSRGTARISTFGRRLLMLHLTLQLVLRAGVTITPRQETLGLRCFRARSQRASDHRHRLLGCSASSLPARRLPAATPAPRAPPEGSGGPAAPTRAQDAAAARRPDSLRCYGTESRRTEAAKAEGPGGDDGSRGSPAAAASRAPAGGAAAASPLRRAPWHRGGERRGSPRWEHSPPRPAWPLGRRLSLQLTACRAPALDAI